MSKKYIPTFKSTAWNYPKFHELTHIVDDMMRFGAPQNLCAQRPESLLIVAAKQPRRRAQETSRRCGLRTSGPSTTVLLFNDQHCTVIAYNSAMAHLCFNPVSRPHLRQLIHIYMRTRKVLHMEFLLSALVTTMSQILISNGIPKPMSVSCSWTIHCCVIFTPDLGTQ